MKFANVEHRIVRLGQEAQRPKEGVSLAEALLVLEFRHLIK
jgi:hypothetical protein